MLPEKVDIKMSSPVMECRRYFAISKKIPKDVKRYCGMCRQHGVMVETRGHNCTYKNCECPRCLLIRQRRRIMSTQIRLRRAQDKKFQRTSEPAEADVIPHNRCDSSEKSSASDVNAAVEAKNMCYFCQKCKNHGILMWKKDHKRHCRFADCTCEQCELIETRRKLDQHLKGSRLSKTAVPKGVIEYALPRSNSSTTNCISPMLNPLKDEKLFSSLADMNSLYMPFMLPVSTHNENGLLSSLNLNTPSMLPFGALSNGIASLGAFQVTPPSSLFACSQALASTVPVAPMPFERPSFFSGGLASVPTEPIVGQIPEEMTAFSSFLTNVRHLEALFHHHSSNLIPMLNV